MFDILYVIKVGKSNDLNQLCAMIFQSSTYTLKPVSFLNGDYICNHGDHTGIL